MNSAAQQAYHAITHPEGVITLLGNFLNDSRTEAIAALQKSGVAISNNASAKAVRQAWISALKDSEQFREQASATLTQYLLKLNGKKAATPTAAASNFVTAGTSKRFYNSVGDDSGDDSSDDSSADDNPITPFAPLAPVQIASTAPMLPVGTISSNPNYIASSAVPTGKISDTAPSSGGILSTLGSIFTPAVLQSVVKTGLNAYSTSVTASANASSEKNALALQQQKLAAAQLAAQTPSTGLSTGWMIAIGVGIGAVVITTIVLLVRRKKR